MNCGEKRALWCADGYDVAKMFGRKFDVISPVWLQLREKERNDGDAFGEFFVSGLHDVDTGWLDDLRSGCHTTEDEGRTCPLILPRLAWEARTMDVEDRGAVAGACSWHSLPRRRAIT